MRGTHVLLLFLCLRASPALAQRGPTDGASGLEAPNAAQSQAEAAAETVPNADGASAQESDARSEEDRTDTDAALTGDAAASPTSGTVASGSEPVVEGASVQPSESHEAVDLSQPPLELPSRIPPYVTMVVGALSTAVGLALGVIPALNCSGRCRPNGWAGGFVMGGVSVGTLGGVWLYDVNTQRRALITKHKLSDPRRLLSMNALQYRF